ncbi:hypothetical protein SSX86_015840 [Deinandra increscens subsp. villosa]|uniref:glutathione transferase n=1 Tax=Deinandra increscens subsp. villosa TaxID=3103831 RepID=A0AAP0D151_9ASTR
MSQKSGHRLKFVAGADAFGCALKDTLVSHLRSLHIEVEDLGTDSHSPSTKKLAASSAPSLIPPTPRSAASSPAAPASASPSSPTKAKAITKYITEAYADKGTRKDLKKSAIETVWTEVEAQKFDPATSKLTWELFFKPLLGMTTDEAVVAEFEKKLEPVLDLYEEARLTLRQQVILKIKKNEK